MKLSIKQKEALELIKEEKSISVSSSKVHKNTMNSLYFKELVRLPRYANGEFWELTNKGLEQVNKERLKNCKSLDDIEDNDLGKDFFASKQFQENFKKSINAKKPKLYS